MNGGIDVLNRFIQYVINPAMQLLFAAALFYFMWGMMMFLWSLDEGEHTEGKQHMLWGVIGMFIMVSVWGIIQIIENSFGIGRQNDYSTINDITVPPFLNQ